MLIQVFLIYICVLVFLLNILRVNKNVMLIKSHYILYFNLIGLILLFDTCGLLNYKHLHREDGVLENLTAIFVLLASVFLLQKFVKPQKKFKMFFASIG